MGSKSETARLIAAYDWSATLGPIDAWPASLKTVTAFLLHLVKDGKVRLDLQDEIIRETLLTRGGELVNQRVREFFSQPGLVSAGGN